MEELITFLEDKKEKVLLGGGKAAIDKQHQNGKLTTRERIFLLLDEDSFEETDLPFPSYGLVIGVFRYAYT